MKLALVVAVALVAALMRWTEAKWSPRQTARKKRSTASASDYDNVSCEFSQNDLCGWTSKRNIAMSNTLKWTIGRHLLNEDYLYYWDYEYFAHLNVNAKPKGNQGVLASPSIQPKPPGYRCQLLFRYYLQNDDGCRLSLFQRVDGILSLLWNSTKASYFNETLSSKVNCTGGFYKLYFKGERISNRQHACGKYSKNGIDVDNIVYRVERSEPTHTSVPTTATTDTSESELTSIKRERTTAERISTSTHTTSVTSLLTTSVTTSSNTPQGNDNASHLFTNSSTEGLSSSSIVGIIIAVVVGVAAIIVVVVIVSRRQHRDGGETKSWMTPWFRNVKHQSASQHKIQNAVSNSGYVPDDQFITSAQVQTPGAQGQSNADLDHVYNTPEEPYVNIATTVNSGSAYKLAGLPQHADQHPTYSKNSHSQDAYELANTTGDQTKDTAKKGKESKQDSVYEFAEPPANEIKTDENHDYYNQTNLIGTKNEASAPPSEDTYDHTNSDRLNLQNPKATTDDTYNHTGPQDNIVKNQTGSTSDPGFDDTYDHTQALRLDQKDQDDTYDHTHDDQVPKATPNSDDTSPRRVESPNDKDEYAVPPTKNMSIPTTGKAAAIADGSRTMHASKQAAKGKRTAAKGKPGYENLTKDHPKTSAHTKQARLQDNTEYSLAKNTTPAQSSPEATESEASVYEVVDHDEDHDKSTAYVPADDVYNELDVRGESAAEQKVQQRHYDHVHDPDEYSELHGEDWTRDQKREAEADQYNHIHNC